MSLLVRIDCRERDTILAALRFWQRSGQGHDLCDIAEEHGKALDAGEIDSLCEKLNTEYIDLSQDAEYCGECGCTHVPNAHEVSLDDDVCTCFELTRDESAGHEEYCAVRDPRNVVDNQSTA